MRFCSSLTLAGLASLATTSVLAQAPFFGAPQNLAQVTVGEEVVVSVFQGDTNSQFENVAIALGISQCFNGADSCSGAGGGLFDVFYTGPFNATGLVGANHFQNFTVTIPSFFEAGQFAQVTAALFALVGAEENPSLETTAVILEVV
ncbi:hypothetical protein BDP27DRAFT_1455817 [Rhodocollybia butyracea]|uniref:Uncharacterized protein n=1 Tax=Rhodocollybia butyracea TaxID=206335 RepID=A0A9P5TWB5_9AGAR|nr:hypothetical protein BDP27DRAFT_1455817 [Rhodocollybia butyracea]